MNLFAILRPLALGTLFFSSAQLTAQEGKVRWKVLTNFENAPDEGTCFAKVVRGDGGSFVGLRVKGSSTVLGGLNQVELDRTLESYTIDGVTKIKFDKTKVLWGEGPVTVETIERFGGQFRVFATKADPEKAKLLLIQQVLSPRSLTGKGAQLLTEIPFDRLGKGADYFKPNVITGFTSTVGVDSTKLLIGLTPQSTTRSAGCPVFAQVFDKQMKLLWTNTLSVDASARTIDIIDTKVDPSGAVWYLIKNITNPDPKTKEDLGYNITLYRLDSVGQQSTVLDLPGNDFAQDISMDMLADGRMLFGGVYGGEETNRNESKGIYRCVFDAKTSAFTGFKLYEFEKRIEKKEERWQINMKIDRVLWKKNGGAFVVAKKSGIETHYVADLSGKKTAKTEQVDGALHIWELDAAGEQKWTKVIERMLGYDNDIPGRVITLVYDDALLIMLNDHEANFEKRKLKTPLNEIATMKDAVVFEFKPDGGEKGKVVLKEGFKQMGFQASRVWKLDKGLIVTTGSEGFGKGKTWPVVITLSSEAKK